MSSEQSVRQPTLRARPAARRVWYRDYSTNPRIIDTPIPIFLTPPLSKTGIPALERHCTRSVLQECFTVPEFSGEIKAVVSGWFIIQRENGLKMEQEHYNDSEESNGEERAWRDAAVFAVLDSGSTCTQKERPNIVENVGFLEFWMKHSWYMMSITTTRWCPVASTKKWLCMTVGSQEVIFSSHRGQA